MPGVIIDIGTGDGEFVYKLARENPDRFVIGIDPHHRGLESVSARTNKKPAKGGITNALFVLSSIEDLPEELNGTANQVFINFPWAGLLKGILLAEDTAWEPLKRVCKKGALIDVLFSYEPDAEDSEFKKLGLPPVDLAFLENITRPRLQQKGLSVITVKTAEADDIRKYPSTWAKKLSYGRDRRYFYLRLKT